MATRVLLFRGTYHDIYTSSPVLVKVVMDRSNQEVHRWLRLRCKSPAQRRDVSHFFHILGFPAVLFHDQLYIN